MSKEAVDGFVGQAESDGSLLEPGRRNSGSGWSERHSGAEAHPTGYPTAVGRLAHEWAGCSLDVASLLSPLSFVRSLTTYRSSFASR